MDLYIPLGNSLPSSVSDIPSETRRPVEVHQVLPTWPFRFERMVILWWTARLAAESQRAEAAPGAGCHGTSRVKLWTRGSGRSPWTPGWMALPYAPRAVVTSMWTWRKVDGHTVHSRLQNVGCLKPRSGCISSTHAPFRAETLAGTLQAWLQMDVAIGSPVHIWNRS